MSSSFPGPPRPRFRLRRTTRYPTTSYIGTNAGSASYDGGSSLTRRGLLGAASLIAVGGVAESIRLLLGSGSGSNVANPQGLSRAVTALLEGSANARSGALPSPSASSSPLAHPTPTHHATSHPHSHSHAHSHGTHHVHPDHAKHETKRQREARLRAERVTLPPAQLTVRERPAYQVNQLIPDPPERALALTIDDGPDPEYTPKVLRLLDKYDTQASFCVIGEHADAYPKLVRDIANAGHVLVNHSYTHVQPFPTLSEKRIVWEITKTQHAIERAAGVTPQLFRAPGGAWSRFIFRAVAAYGLEPVDWDVDPQDWARPGTKNIERAMLKARAGEIVLCHDGGGNRSETVRALRKVLPTWQNKGLVTIPLSVSPNYLPGSKLATSNPPVPFTS